MVNIAHPVALSCRALTCGCASTVVVERSLAL